MKSILTLIGALLLLSSAALTAAQSDAPVLPGTQWTLVSYGLPGEETPVPPDALVTLEFQDEQRVAGSGGCNSYGGTYTVTADTITFSDVASTKMACEATMDLETAYFAALAATSSFEVTDDTLTIWYDDGEHELNFVRVADNPLFDLEWSLVSWGKPGQETPVVEGSVVTLKFDRTGHIAGNGGCNGYGGNYAITDDGITLTEIVSTLMACENDAVTTQESTYLAALNTVANYEVSEEDYTLTLWYEDGQQLNFVATQESRLMNGEWRLISYGTTGEETPVVPGSTVTLIFGADAHVSGSGGCNGYGGGYSLNGEKIAFTEVISTLMACADNAVTAQEQDYFAALAAADRFALDGDTLTIWYEAGQKQLNFVRDEASTEAMS